MEPEKVINKDLLSMVEKAYALQREVNDFLYSSRMVGFEDYHDDMKDLSDNLGAGITFFSEMIGFYAVSKVEESLK